MGEALASPDELAAKLGIEIDPELLRVALTHRSYAYEHEGVRHNERLEFLGDAVLGLAVTVMLFERFPDIPEGELAKRRSSLVSSDALAVCARGIELGRYLRLGRGEELTHGRQKASILADALEAVFGIVHLACGAEVARDLVLRLIAPLAVDESRYDTTDPKTSLQEYAARQGLGTPVYEVTSSGPDHSKRFRATVLLGGRAIARGEATSKKRAEMAAALEAWSRLRAESS